MQKIGPQYIGKKLYDTLMAPPPQPVQVEDEEGAPKILAVRNQRP